jgi:hypothetical protein
MSLQIKTQISNALETVMQLRRSVENISGVVRQIERELRDALHERSDNASSAYRAESPPLVIQPLSPPPYLKHKRSRVKHAV